MATSGFEQLVAKRSKKKPPPHSPSHFIPGFGDIGWTPFHDGATGSQRSSRFRDRKQLDTPKRRNLKARRGLGNTMPTPGSIFGSRRRHWS